MSFCGFFNLVLGSLLMNFEVIKLTFSLEHLPWGGNFSSLEELKDTMCIPWGGTRTLPRDCTVASWLLLSCLCIPSFPWLASVPWMPTRFGSVSRGGWGSYTAILLPSSVFVHTINLAICLWANLTGCWQEVHNQITFWAQVVPSGGSSLPLVDPQLEASPKHPLLRLPVYLLAEISKYFAEITEPPSGYILNLEVENIATIF